MSFNASHMQSTIVIIFPGGLSHWVQLSVNDRVDTQFILVDKSSVRYKVALALDTLTLVQSYMYMYLNACNKSFLVTI